MLSHTAAQGLSRLPHTFNRASVINSQHSTLNTQAYRAVREGVGLLDRSARGKLVISGSDRYSWLQGMVSNDVRALAAGAPTIDSCILDATGHLRTDLRVVRRDDSLLLDLPRLSLEDTFHLLEGFVVMEDVEVVDQTDFLAILSLQGPAATEAIVRVAESDALVVPADHTGSGGLDLYTRRDRADGLRDRLIETGAVPVDEATAEVLRIEAGIPKLGVDMDERTIPLEAGLEATHISHAKGCYVGQEIIARIVARGHTNRALMGLLVEGDELPQHGDAITATEDGTERETGWVTSACHSPRLGRVIAMGYVRHEHRDPGTGLQILRDGRRIDATVAEMPFLGRPATGER